MFCRFTDFCRNIFVKRWIKPYDFSLMLTMFLMVSVWVSMLVSYCIQIAANYFHSVLLILWMFQWRIGLIDDIPIPSERCYKLQLMDKIDQVIKRMRWKACFIQTEARIRKKPGLKLLNCPQKIKEMVHTLLIAKLNAYGLRLKALKLMNNSEGDQRTKTNKHYSFWEQNLFWLPQGSILRPILFDIFLRDQFFSLLYFSFFSYFEWYWIC